MTNDADLARRLDRLEATEAIRQLAARYALALDSRDVQTLACLFVPDVQTGDGRVGREALAEWFDPILRPYATTFHLIGNHIIDFWSTTTTPPASSTADPEHEVGDLWVVMPMQYWDRYERRDGAVVVQESQAGRLLRRRHPRAPVAGARPLQLPGQSHARPSRACPRSGRAWREFWARTGSE